MWFLLSVKVVIAYSAFYVVLILFFMVLLGFALLCMDDIRPFRVGAGTPLQHNPGKSSLEMTPKGVVIFMKWHFLS